jgi:hypothetical protein
VNTGNVESWSGTITDIGPIYPLVGTEGLLVIVALVSWIAWHVLQARGESKAWDEELRMFGDKQSPSEERLDD